MNLIGLDFETSGLDRNYNAPIQLGIATQPPDQAYFESLIGGWHWGDRLFGLDSAARRWDEEAESVHRITPDELESAPSVETVDDMAETFIIDTVGHTHPSRVRLVGWNVGSFDYQWLLEYFPKTAALVSYRSVDLSALLTFTAEAMQLPEDALKTSVNMQARDALAMRGHAPNWHNATYDAMAALEVYESLKEIILDV